MSSFVSSDELIERLTASLKPSRPLSSPGFRAIAWLTIVIFSAFVLSGFANLEAVKTRLLAASDMWLAALGAVLTTILAAFAAFQLCMPDRTPRWALLPLPGIVLWVGASGFGCLRSWVLPPDGNVSRAEAPHCLAFILLVSLPLSILLLIMLRRGFSLRPNLTAALGGLAAASAAASLLTLIHPYDAAAIDLGIHFAAVLLVIGTNAVIAGGALYRPND